MGKRVEAGPQGAITAKFRFHSADTPMKLPGDQRDVTHAQVRYDGGSIGVMEVVPTVTTDIKPDGNPKTVTVLSPK